MCPGYDGNKKEKHDWRLFGTGYFDQLIHCDIICAECGKCREVVIRNNKKGNETVEKILNNNRIFKIPRSIYVAEEI